MKTARRRPRGELDFHRAVTLQSLDCLFAVLVVLDVDINNIDVIGRARGHANRRVRPRGPPSVYLYRVTGCRVLPARNERGLLLLIAVRPGPAREDTNARSSISERVLAHR